jgi:hypothetical protein
MDEKKKNIYETITAVMAEIGAVGKDSRNEQQRFMYRGIDAVMNAINPALIKHKLFVVPEILEQRREERLTAKGGNLIYSICTVKYTFYAEDGSSVSAIVIGEGMDSGDKATNKAMSVAFKYACFQTFCIPTEEMKDPDAETMPPSKPVYATAEQRKMFADECKRIGKSKSAILKAIGARSLEELTVQQFETAMEAFEKTPSAAQNKAEQNTVPPDDTGDGLPWNTPAR